MATQSFLTSDMQSLNSVVQQVTTGQQSSLTTGQKTVTLTANPSQSLYSGQKTVTLSNPAHSTQGYNHTQKTVALSNNPSQTTILQPTQGYSGQQFIVTISGDPANSENMQEVEIQQGTPSQVIYQAGHNQYVESGHHAGPPHNQSLYAASNGQMQSYSDYNQVYNPATGTYFHTTGGGQMTQIGGLPGQLVQGGTYLVSSAMDSDGQHITHTTRASPATDANQQRSSHFDVKSWQREMEIKSQSSHVQWLIDNYETAEGVSLPRSTLYNHYLRHCQEQKIDPMNPASFGKLIRSVFLGLRTRRLGTRGNSKYHYYGIKLRMDSPLNAMEEVIEPIYTQQPVQAVRRGNSKYHYYGIRIKPDSPLNAFTDDHALPMRQQSLNQAKRFKTVGSVDGKEMGGGAAENTQQYQHQQFLGDASGAIPAFGCVEIKRDQLPDGITIEHVRIFEDLFQKHCEQILGTVVNLQFSEVEKIWQTFWRTTPPELRQNADIMAEQRLSKEKLYTMCKLPAVKEFVKRSDYTYYQALVEVLIPDVLRPIPSSLTQAVRNFAKTLENWLKSAMVGVPEDMVKAKITSVCAFAQTLRRYTSLNHLAQAARAVLQNTTQINQMLTDLNRVDFANVQEQASWVCQCEDGLVQQIQEDFKKTLQGQNSLEAWALWLEGVVNQVLAPHEGGPNFAKAARQFLLKWSFYSSMVIRDLTLRSAASFGSFHLIRLLYDEYMFYLVEHKVAAATDESPIAVMGEVRYQSLESNLGSSDIESKAQLHAAINSISRSIGSNTVVYANSIQTTTATAHATTVPATPTLAQVGHLSNQGASTSGLQGARFTQVTSAHGGLSSTKFGNLNNIQGGHPTTVAVVASAPGGTGPKTIVVVPVSANATGSGDAQPAIKRIKTIQ